MPTLDEDPIPNGELVLQTLTLPKDTNSNGDVLVAGLCHKWIWPAP